MRTFGWRIGLRRDVETGYYHDTLICGYCEKKRRVPRIEYIRINRKLYAWCRRCQRPPERLDW